jgi:tetratricopeptide (TPR) repeat protein
LPEFTRRDILFYSIRSSNKSGEELDFLKTADILKIKKATVRRNLNILKQEGYIDIIRNITGRIVNIEITEVGLDFFDNLVNTFNQSYIEPDRSGFAKRVSIENVLHYLKDPYEEMEFLYRYSSVNENDLTNVLDEIKTKRSDSRLSMYIREVLSIDGDNDVGSLEETLKSTSLYSEYRIDHGFTSTNTDINSLIIEAELLRRRGDIGEAMCIYTGILQRKTGIETGRWMIAIAGMAQCQVYLNREIEAMKFLDNMKSSMNDPVERGFMDKLEADILQDLDRYDEASELYRSCLGVFQENEFPLIRLTILNNLGVQYCRKEKMKIATDFWEEALKISEKVSLPYVEAIISLNLADAYSQKKRFYKAEELLRNAAKVLKSVGDLEGLSGVDFNKSLVFIEKGEKKKALKYFEEAMKFPLTYKRKREERRRVFKGRMKAKGVL